MIADGQTSPPFTNGNTTFSEPYRFITYSGGPPDSSNARPSQYSPLYHPSFSQRQDFTSANLIETPPLVTSYASPIQDPIELLDQTEWTAWNPDASPSYVPDDQTYMQYPYASPSSSQRYLSPLDEPSPRMTHFSGEGSPPGSALPESSLRFIPSPSTTHSNNSGSDIYPYPYDSLRQSTSLPSHYNGHSLSNGLPFPLQNNANNYGTPSPANEWSYIPNRPPFQRPIRKSESDTTHPRTHPPSAASSPGNSLAPLTSSLPRTPPPIGLTSSIHDIQYSSPRQTASPHPRGPGRLQVRYAGTKADASSGSSPGETAADPESDDGSSKKKRRREGPGKEQAPKKSLLQPPKASPSTWQIYFTDQLPLYRARHPNQKLNVAQAAKELAQEYKFLTEAQREPYKRRAQLAKAERERQLLAWERTLTPGDVKAENEFRTAQRKGGKSRKANMRDPNAPKKPLSAYFMFLQKIRSSEEMVKEVFGEETGTTRQSVLAAAKWRAMSDDEKKPFLARAEQEKLQYEAARRDYEEGFADGEGGTSGMIDFSSGHFVGIEQLSLADATLAIKPSSSNALPLPSRHKAQSSDDFDYYSESAAFEESLRGKLPTAASRRY